MAENSGKKQRGPGRPFAPGVSGNPKGRPKGARTKVIQFAENLMAGQLDGIVSQVIEQALQGCVTSQKMVLDRLVPVRKDSPVRVNINGDSTRELLKSSREVLSAVGEGSLAPSEGDQLLKLLEAHRKLIEAGEIEQRLQILEQQMEVKR